LTLRLIFDIETDGFLDKLTKIHCIEAEDIDTGALYHFTPREIEDGVRLLMQADQLIGHNILEFDIPAIEKVYPWFAERKAINPSLDSIASLEDIKEFDTLVCSRVIWTNLFDLDMSFKRKQIKAGGDFKLMGNHGLKAWGQRLAVLKGDYNEGDDEQIWERWSQEMQDYCAQDVQVTKRFYQHVISKDYSVQCFALEHQFKKAIVRQEQVGWHFDRKSAALLYAELAHKKAELTTILQAIFPPIEIRTPFTPKVNNAKRGYIKGIPTEKVTTVVFNPGSDKQIGERLMSLGWEPQEFTPGGQPKVGEDNLEGLALPGVPELIEYATIGKIMGQLSEGKNAWMKVEKDGKVYGRVNTNGAVTGRCTHKIIVNVPRVTSPYGKEMRSLLTAPPGDDWVLLGCDASGLELRCLAHFMARYDGGAYIKVVTEGDVHTENQRAAGLPTRDNAKTFI
jgi:DNA polymerase-1